MMQPDCCEQIDRLQQLEASQTIHTSCFVPELVSKISTPSTVQSNIFEICLSRGCNSAAVAPFMKSAYRNFLVIFYHKNHKIKEKEVLA